MINGDSLPKNRRRRGAAILDVNMGMSGVDEKEMMLNAIDEVARYTAAPVPSIPATSTY